MNISLYSWKDTYVLWKGTYGELVIFQVNISLYSWKGTHVSWKGTYGELVIFLHKTVNKDWNLFNLSELSPKNSRKFRFSNFHFMKPYSPSSNIIITTYHCIYNISFPSQKITTNPRHYKSTKSLVRTKLSYLCILYCFLCPIKGMHTLNPSISVAANVATHFLSKTTKTEEFNTSNNAEVKS